MRRRNEIKVRLTDDELEQLNLKVKKTMLSREEFVRTAIKGGSIVERPPAEYGEIVKQLRRIGANVDQLLVVARVKEFIDELKLKDIAEQLDRMDRLFISSFSSKT